MTSSGAKAGIVCLVLHDSVHNAHEPNAIPSWLMICLYRRPRRLSCNRPALAVQDLRLESA